MFSLGLHFEDFPHTANAHEGTLARAQDGLYEYCRHSGKIYLWGQVAEALGRNTLQRSIHERPGKTRDSDVTQQVLELHCLLGHGYPWAQQILSLTSGVILSWNFLSFVSHWIN